MSYALQPMPTPTLVLSQALPLTRQVSWRSKPGDPVAHSLEDVHAHLQQQRQRQRPAWLNRSPSNLRVAFGDGARRATIQPLEVHGPRSYFGAERVFTEHGLRSLARHVLPAHGMRTVNALLATNARAPRTPMGQPSGTMAADLLWMQLARVQDTKPITLREYTTVDPATGKDVRAIRAAFTRYTEIDNLEFVEDLLSFSDLANLPVLSFVETDTAMRLRFALEPIDRFDLHKPIPMVEAWNSEVGRRSLGFCSGLWWGKCTNGMASWEVGNRWTWRHTGNRARIRQEIPQAITEVKIKTRGLAEQYEQAIGTALDDAHRWMTQTLGGRDGVLSSEVIDAASLALDHPTTHPGRMLASVVDAITLVAQRQIDLYEQQRIESAAMYALRRGLLEADA